ncbi:MAG: hypothetical protein ABIH99_02135, partial [Candidatus Micrarchaeota archaeon]
TDSLSGKEFSLILRKPYSNYLFLDMGAAYFAQWGPEAQSKPTQKQVGLGVGRLLSDSTLSGTLNLIDYKGAYEHYDIGATLSYQKNQVWWLNLILTQTIYRASGEYGTSRIELRGGLRF